MTIEALYELGVPVVPVGADPADPDETPREAVLATTDDVYLVAPADGDGPVHAVAGDKDDAVGLGVMAADTLGWLASDPYGAESNTRQVWVVAVSAQ
jgi:hypothetical protein